MAAQRAIIMEIKKGHLAFLGGRVAGSLYSPPLYP
jgi:hypothetical protein